MGHREIYPNPPLVMVVVELRHPASPLTDADQASLKAMLADAFPLFKPARRLNVTMSNVGLAQEQVLVDARYMTRDRTVSITYRPDSIVVEATRYGRRSELRNLLWQAIEARQKVAPADGIERLGIRYINEVRASGVDSSPDWGKWISSPLASLSQVTTEAGESARTWQGLAIFGDAINGVVLRHGIFDGYAVDPGGDLRRTTPPPGPFYLVDLDCFWMPDGETPPLEWAGVEPHFDEAALAAYDMFEQLITDRYREEVMRDDQRPS
jgi:uncharacterized protein (TIGR04255 family)